VSVALGRLLQKRTSRGIVTRRVDLRRRGARFGVRIVLFADVHARFDWFPPEEVARLVDAVRAVPDVDLVAMVGDFTGDDPSAIDASAAEYRRIQAPLFATLGNHDHWAGPHHAVRALTAASVEVLTNRAVPLASVVGEARGGSAWLAGIDSCWTRTKSSLPGADPATAFADVPNDAEVIVLGHEPHLATLHEHALHLAGHTHCGQIRSPILGDWSARTHMPRFSEPFPCRLYEVPVDHSSELPANHRTAADRRWVYTTGGVGFSTIDARGFCPPEIVVVDC
jgi:predicted MPP superfamily phosphohydrolase